MRKMCILSHGMFAKGIQQSLTFFLGDTNPYAAISAYVDDDQSVPKDQLDEFMKGVNDDDQVLFLTDIMGGSVNTMVMPYLSRPNTYIIAGVNFPLLLQLAATPEDSDIEAYRKVVSEGQKSIVLMNDIDFSQFSSEGDE